MLKLPLTSTLLATLLLGSDGLSVTPQVVVAVAVAFVVITMLPEPGRRSAPAARTDGTPGRPTPVTPRG
jgi:hypothetical protein